MNPYVYNHTFCMNGLVMFKFSLHFDSKAESTERNLLRVKSCRNGMQTLRVLECFWASANIQNPSGLKLGNFSMHINSRGFDCHFGIWADNNIFIHNPNPNPKPNHARELARTLCARIQKRQSIYLRLAAGIVVRFFVKSRPQ